MQFKRRDGLLSAIFSILTCGLYSIYYWYQYGEDVNVICADDGKVTQNYIVAWLLGIITCGIYSLYWIYNLASRLDTAGEKYKVNVESPALFTLIMSIPFLSYFYSCDVLNKFAEKYEQMYAEENGYGGNGYYGNTYPGNGYGGNGYDGNGYAGNGFGGGVPPVSPRGGSGRNMGNTAQSLGAQVSTQFKSAVQDMGSSIRNTAQNVMPVCKNCGATISPGKNYCKRCGYPINGPAPANTQSGEADRKDARGGQIPPADQREVRGSQIPPLDQREVRSSEVPPMEEHVRCSGDPAAETKDVRESEIPPMRQSVQEETIQLVWPESPEQEKPVAEQRENAAEPLCPKCGSAVKPGDRFCIHCGSKIE